MPLLAFTLVAASLGAMLFFLAVVAPTVFRTLPEAEAGAFVRALFPRYYLVLGAVSALAALLAGLGERWTEAALLALVAAGFAVARQGLMPRINALSDRVKAGEAAAAPAFASLHRASVSLNAAQLVGLALIGVLLAQA